jgi:hypothetical protein
MLEKFVKFVKLNLIKKKSIEKTEDTHLGNNLGVPFATSIAENKNFCSEKKCFSFSALFSILRRILSASFYL